MRRLFFFDSKRKGKKMIEIDEFFANEKTSIEEKEKEKF